MTPFDDIDIAENSFCLRDAQIHRAFLDSGDMPVEADDAVRCDVIVRGGRIEAILPSGDAVDPTLPIHDLAGRHIWPGLVDAHVHLDKCQAFPRLIGADGTFAGARDATTADREAYWSYEDLYRRMSFGLRAAYAHGVTATRTHLDSPEPQAEISWRVFRRLRDEWRGRIDLQAVAFVPLDVYGTPFGARLAQIAADAGGVLGAVTRSTHGLHGMPFEGFERLLDQLFGLAEAHDLDLDLHVDESGDPNARALAAVAEATIRHGYEGRVTCGHCCSLAVQPEEAAARTIARVAEAEISVITLPVVNMYLQDRTPGRSPRWRGVPPVAELSAAGVSVAVAGDNCRDAFYAYGDHDLFDTFRQAVRILQLDNPVGDAPALVTSVPAGIMRLPDQGTLRVGGRADFNLFNARNLNELLSRPQGDRILVRGGLRVRPRLPEYSELDPPRDHAPIQTIRTETVE
ncbi:cytosine deaminase [Celeribacter indicus]|uniref:Cytosine deaminase-like protein n=1 Tax=Celeribacter indicus TaxID=1208324 RepID=A0A0B5E2S3_9RHOB|nr:cytosine deaminase [Celeribacter indicus]AJE46747.1 cytosine deaminase-like protein [Celeribacter indicus]SDX05467.1 cytosine deaminase [Celeribacter indicus]